MPLSAEIGLTDKMHQIGIAGRIGSEQHDRRFPRRQMPAAAALAVAAILHIDRQLTADDRLEPLAHGLLGKLQGTEEIICIGHGNCRLPVGHGELHHRLQRQRALEQRIGRVNAQMHETNRLLFAFSLHLEITPSSPPNQIRHPILAGEQRRCNRSSRNAQKPIASSRSTPCWPETG